MLDLVQQGLKLLDLIVPVFTFVFGVFLAYRLIRTARNFGIWWEEISKSPTSFVFGIVVIGLTLFLFIKYIKPLFDGLF